MSCPPIPRTWLPAACALLLVACGGPLPLPPMEGAEHTGDVPQVAAPPAPAFVPPPAPGPAAGRPPAAHAAHAARDVTRAPPVRAAAWAASVSSPPEVAVSGTDVRVDGATAEHPLVVWQFELRAPTGEPVVAQVAGGPGLQGAGVAVVADAGLPEGALRLWPLQPLAPGVAYTAYLTAMPHDGSAPVTRSWTVTADPGG